MTTESNNRDSVLAALKGLSKDEQFGVLADYFGSGAPRKGGRAKKDPAAPKKPVADDSYIAFNSKHVGPVLRAYAERLESDEEKSLYKGVDAKAKVSSVLWAERIKDAADRGAAIAAVDEALILATFERVRDKIGEGSSVASSKKGKKVAAMTDEEKAAHEAKKAANRKAGAEKRKATLAAKKAAAAGGAAAPTDDEEEESDAETPAAAGGGAASAAADDEEEVVKEEWEWVRTVRGKETKEKVLRAEYKGQTLLYRIVDEENDTFLGRLEGGKLVAMDKDPLA